MAICGAVLSSWLFCVQGIAAQEEALGADTSIPTVVTGAAFSAVTYTRTVRVQPEGQSTVVAEGHRMLVARDADGRIFMKGLDPDRDNCDLPSLGKLPACDFWRLLIFDPSARVMWHWTDGGIADKVQMVLMDLRDDQITDAERQTSVLERPPNEPPAEGITVRDLGERNFGGIEAKGIRTVIEHKGIDGRPSFQIHEVWSSVKMRLLLMVIDGNPMGEERISGLAKISLAPDPSLFRPPQDRVVRHWKDSDRFATGDITALSLWPVK